MNTLSDVNTRRGGIYPPSIGFISNTIPEANDLEGGVSVRYAKDISKKWYVLRATYGRADKAYKIIKRDKQEAYIPFHYVERVISEKKKRVAEPLLPSLIFVYASESYVTSLVTNSFLSFYFNHFIVDKDGKNPPLTVKYEDMINFINLTSIKNEHIRIVEPSQCRYKSGEMVRITDGKFKGIIGRVARTAGEQRVVVEIAGLCLVATAYIPTAFIVNLKTPE